MNSITIAGNLGADAETKRVGDSTVTEFSVADSVYQKGERTTQWWRCAMWGARGEKVAPKLTKGTKVTVTGALVVREYEGRKGLGYSLDVRVHDVALQGVGRGEQPPADEADPWG